MTRDVSVMSASTRFDQIVSVGPHEFHSDETRQMGGMDTGPNPHEWLMCALGTCISITLQMYAQSKKWPLNGVQVDLSYSRALAEKGVASGAAIGMVDRIEVAVSLSGNLSDDQRARLMEIAGRCPIHRMLVSGIEIDTRDLTQWP